MSEEQFNGPAIINKIDSIEREVVGSFMKLYCRGNDYNGDEDYHHFIVYADDILSRDWITEFASFIELYDPDRVDLSTTSEYPHLTLGFKPNRIMGDIEEYIEDETFWSTTVAERAKSGECIRCRRKTPDAYPPLVLRRKRNENSNEWRTSIEEEKMDLCVLCSPAHFDDVTRQINALCVGNEGNIVAVDYGENMMYTDDPEFNDRHIERVIKILERDIL